MAKEKQDVENEVRWSDLDLTPHKWEEGQVIEGKLTGIRDGRYGKIFTFDLLSGKMYNVFGSQALEGILTPDKIGKDFRITYEGKVKTTSGRPCKQYRVQVRKDEYTQ